MVFIVSQAKTLSNYEDFAMDNSKTLKLLVEAVQQLKAATPKEEAKIEELKASISEILKVFQLEANKMEKLTREKLATELSGPYTSLDFIKELEDHLKTALKTWKERSARHLKGS